MDSPTRTQPKFNLQHGTFIANLENSSPIKPKKLENRDPSVTSLNKEFADDFQSKSSQVIESLHQKIDTLTDTNLQLTIQSNKLLDRLEEANLREAKYLDSINKLKIENTNTSTMYERKNRRVKELELELKNALSSLAITSNENKDLNERINKTGSAELALKEELLMYQTQYQALQDAHFRYKQQYEEEIENMKIEVREVSRNYEKFLSQKYNNLDDLDVKWNSSYNKLFCTVADMRELQTENLKELTRQVREIQAEHELSDNLTSTYKSCRDMVFEYANKLDLDIEKNFKDAHHSVEGTFSMQLKDHERRDFEARERIEALRKTEKILSSTPTKETQVFDQDMTHDYNTSTDSPVGIKLRNSKNISRKISNSGHNRRNSSFYGTMGTYMEESDISENSITLENDNSFGENPKAGRLSFMQQTQNQENGHSSNLNAGHMSTKQKRASWLATASLNNRSAVNSQQSGLPGNVPYNLAKNSVGSRQISPLPKLSAKGAHSSNISNSHNGAQSLPGLTKTHHLPRRSISNTDSANEDIDHTSTIKRAGSIKRRY